MIYKGNLLKNIDFIINDDRDVTINNIKICIRDSVFLSYYLIRKGEYDKAKLLIEGIAADINNIIKRYSDVALWIWIVSEYTNATKDKILISKYLVNIEQYIDYIFQNWDKPHDNWLGLLEQDVYISNIAIDFGAIQSINNCIRNEKAQRLLKELKEFIFNKFLVQGKIISGLADKEAMGDISIIAVPFGLMDAGNQILVESIQTLESELVEKGVRFSQRDSFFGGCVRPDLTCLLSWYYSERGDIARAKSLLSQVEESWNKHGKLYEIDTKTAREKVFLDYYMNDTLQKIAESNLAYILYTIADFNTTQKEQSNTKVTNRVEIIHDPEGTGNKYLRETIQRLPLYPVEKDSVLIRIVTQPLAMVQKAYVVYTLNGQEQQKTQMQLESSEEGEKYWEASLGQFSFRDKVEYNFIVETINEDIITSPQNHFVVRRWIPVVNVLHVKASENNLVLNFQPLTNGEKSPSLRITETTKSTLQLSFFMEDIIGECKMQKPFSESFSIGNTTVFVTQKEEYLNLKVNADGIIQSYNKLDKNFIEILIDDSGAVYKVRYNFLLKSDEKFFGMGERYSRIEYRGYNIDNYVYNQYTNQKLRTYIPVPFTICSKGYGVFLNTTMYSMFRFGTRLADLMEIEADIHKEAQMLDTYLFIGTPKEIVQSFTGITGKPVLPPKWAFGPWMSSNNWDSQHETLKQVALTKKHKIPSTVLVLEQWSDEATFYIFNDASYQLKDGNSNFEYDEFTFPEWGRWPSPKKMIEDIHHSGLKVLLWQAPVQRYMDGIAHAQRDEDERVMLEYGYCVKYKNGKPYRVPTYEWFKRSLIPDFSNPDAKQWWLNKRRYLMEGVGIDGFKTDGGECVYGEDLLFYDGRTGEEMRNQYPNDYIRSFHEFANEYIKDGTVTFSRAGYTGAQSIPLHWAGDEWSTFEAYRSSVNAGLSCSLSGIPFWGWDLAGFHGKIPSAELYIRSTQFAAFCPIMQYHAETKGELNRDRTPWNIAERTKKPLVMENYKKYADLRMNLLPYIYDQAKISSDTGIPMMRTMFLEYPDDESCESLTGQYFFGDSLLIAPITEEDGCTKDVYLPKGRWLELLECKEHMGCSLVCEKSDISKIPVYIRENSVIALNLADSLTLCSHVGNQVKGYTNLCFMLYVTRTVKYQFTDDIGNRIGIKASKTKNGYEVEISGCSSQPVTMIVRIPRLAIKSVAKKEKTLNECADENSLEINTYYVRKSELLIKTDRDTKFQIACFKQPVD